MRARLSLVLAAGLAACTAPAAEKASPLQVKEILVGVVAGLTGPNAEYGVPMKNGIALAVQEAKLARPVRALYLDDQSRAADAGQLAQRLAVEEKVDVILGSVSSNGTLAMAPIAERAQVPLITPSATEPMITQHGEYVFRACFVDPFQAEAMAKLARAELKLARVFVLRDVGSEYSIGLANAFAASFAAQGGTVAGDESYAREDEDYAAVLAKIAAAKPEAIYLPGYAQEIGKIAAALRKAKIEARLLGADGFDASTLIETRGAELEGSLFTTHFSADDPRPEVARFTAAYAAAFNESPDALAALGYDAARVALAAIARAGTDDRRALRDAIAATKDFEGVTGSIRFDAKRNAVKPLVVLEIEKGKRTFVSRIAPPSP